jgi:hypothetical protein
MPESSFFNPIGMPPTFQADPNFRAGYRNTYGTHVGASVSPVTRQGSIDFQVPLGDHQRQQFLTGGVYYRPEGGGAPADYGFKVGVSKKIQPANERILRTSSSFSFASRWSSPKGTLFLGTNEGRRFAGRGALTVVLTGVVMTLLSGAVIMI